MNMTANEAFLHMVTELAPHLGEGEASRVCKMVFEDIFRISPNDPHDFSRIHELETLLSRLKKGEPVQYVVGNSHFYGHVFHVNSNVLIPRPETEELVRWVLEDLPPSGSQADILDIGTGSGCIGITLAKEKRTARVFALDYSLDAINVARINAKRLKAQVCFYRLNFLDEACWTDLGMFDILVSNPPYVDKENRSMLADNVLKYEPEMALFAVSDDPLVFYRRIGQFADSHLNEGGKIYVELNEFRVDETVAIFRSQERVREVQVRKDMQGIDRMLRVKFY